MKWLIEFCLFFPSNRYKNIKYESVTFGLVIEAPGKFTAMERAKRRLFYEDDLRVEVLDCKKYKNEP